MIPRRALFLAAAALGLAPGRVALADEVDDALRDIARAREGLKTLIAPFTQERVLGLLATSVTSQGELTLVRPDRMRWELRPPDEAIYWVSPEGVAYRTPQGAGKVSAGSAGALGAVLEDLLLLLGGDLSQLRARHALAVERRSDGSLRLRVTPKSPKLAKLVKQLTADIAANLISPQKLVLEEPGGDRSTIAFDEARINAPVDPAKMKP